MNVHERPSAVRPASLLDKADLDLPALKATSRTTLVIRAGTVFDGVGFEGDTTVALPDHLLPGTDYVVVLQDGAAIARPAETVPGNDVLGGFHFAPGGNAEARAGGDDIPAINPCSLWDVRFRPACVDPRGMVLVEKPGGKFWCDIYLTGADCHEGGTSRFGVTIADGDDRPMDPHGKRYRRFDYETAAAVLLGHGKGLLSLEEFFAAAFGVTERSAAGKDPVKTGLDAARTSKFGVMQATGNLWVWGHDGDPDTPRASLFGGLWWPDDDAGSRYAIVAYYWPDISPAISGRAAAVTTCNLLRRCGSSAA